MGEEDLTGRAAMCRLLVPGTTRCVVLCPKLCQGRFRLGIRTAFFTGRVVRPGSRLPRDMVETPPLEASKRGVDEVLRDVVQWRTRQC